MKTSFPMTAMRFLNEIAAEFPLAVSLAAGRPSGRFLEQLNPSVLVEAFVRYESYVPGDQNKLGPKVSILQYGRTAGIINEIVAQQLVTDAGVSAVADRIMITSGCQEALALCVPALCSSPGDVLLVRNPTYIGAICAAETTGVPVVPLPARYSDIAESIENIARDLAHKGMRARALYLIPNFDNPTGCVLAEHERKAILSVCARSRIVVLEDDPYGMFRYEGTSIAPMAALDTSGSVIYLSTFSKTLAPALRVGSALLPETLFGDRRACRTLFDALIQRKSILTLNTSQISQALVAGLLLRESGTLNGWIQPALALYRANRDLMLSHLQNSLGGMCPQIRWNVPTGGFFVCLDVPFQIDAEAVTECSTNYGVIIMPMRFFSLDDSQNRRIRLAFSDLNPDQIQVGVDSLARYAKYRINRT